MKKFFLLVMVAFATLGASAQFNFNPEDMAKRQADNLKETCALSQEQYDKVLKIYLDNGKKMQAERDSIQKAGGQMNMESFRARQEKTNASLKEILTEEQYAKYEEMQKQMRRRFGGGGDGGHRPRQRQ